VPLVLDRLSAQEAAQLLAVRLGPDRARDGAAVATLAELCARLPLALNILAARALTEPGRPPAEYVAELTGPSGPGRLDALSAGDPATDVRAVFSWSYRKLDPATARLFRLLAVHPGPDLSVAAAASLAGLDHAEARRLLDQLVHAHLLTRLPGPRYTFHDLLRAYAVELARADEPESRAANLRTYDHYLHTAHRAARLVSPGRTLLSMAEPQPGTSPENPADDGEARAWFDAEQAVLSGLIGGAGRLGLDVHAWQLAWTVAEHWDRRGLFGEIVDAQRVALASADRLGDRLAQALVHGALGRALIQTSDLDEGFEHLTLSLEAYRELGDQPAQEALTHTAIAHMHARRADHAEVLRHGELALELFRRIGDRTGEGIALNVVGWSHSQLGAYSEALTICRQSVELSRDLRNRTAEAAALDSLAEVEHHLGDYDAAARHYRQSVDLRLELAQYRLVAGSLTRLGESRIAAGDIEAARRAWAEALAILDRLEHPDATPLRARLRDLPDRAAAVLER
jgi:tetratricopeptide (TPR) repeat protein